MARLHRAAYAVVWVNPLKGSPEYQPLGGRHARRAAVRRPLRGRPRPRQPRGARRACCRKSRGDTRHEGRAGRHPPLPRAGRALRDGHGRRDAPHGAAAARLQARRSPRAARWRARCPAAAWRATSTATPPRSSPGSRPPGVLRHRRRPGVLRRPVLRRRDRRLRPGAARSAGGPRDPRDRGAGARGPVHRGRRAGRGERAPGDRVRRGGRRGRRARPRPRRRAAARRAHHAARARRPQGVRRGLHAPAALWSSSARSTRARRCAAPPAGSAGGRSSSTRARPSPRRSACRAPTSSSVRWPAEALAESAPDHQTAVVILSHDEKFDIPGPERRTAHRGLLHRRDRRAPHAGAPPRAPARGGRRGPRRWSGSPALAGLDVGADTRPRPPSRSSPRCSPCAPGAAAGACRDAKGLDPRACGGRAGCGASP